MQSPRLPLWTLTLRLNGDVLACGLSDGRRLAWWANRPSLVLKGPPPCAVADVVGDELARWLANSEPRPLNVLYDGHELIDRIDWESLSLGRLRLAEHFALGRQILCREVEPTQLAEVALAPELGALRIVCDGAPASRDGLRQLAIAAIDRAPGRELLSEAHVVFLGDVSLPELIESLGTTLYRRLLVVEDRPKLAHVAAALDAGAAVCWLRREANGAASLLRLLGDGHSAGEAIRGLYRRAPGAPLGACLYGDPEMRFVYPSLPATRRQVTSVSFDVVGSTSLLKDLGDEAYSDTLTALHLRCADIVRRHGGRPDEPQGDDGVMGYFGYPVALENAAGRAVEAAIAIVRAAAELGVNVRVGVATGPVAIKAGQPVGLSIHLAARLQQAAIAGTVLVSEPTRRLVSLAFELERREDLPALKGVEDQPAYLVLGPRGEQRGRYGERQPVQQQPIVGREAELERLHDSWRRVQAGAGGLVVISAEAGLGKSRIVRELRHRLVDTDVRVLEVRCRADASASPFLALAEALRRWLDLDRDEMSSLARDKLAAALPEHARHGDALELLADLIGVAPQPLATPASGARARVLGLLVDWLRHFTGGLPCCLIVEDWHWVDPSTREFVARLLRESERLGLLVVITSRGAGVDLAGTTASVHEHIELAGLSAAASRDLVERICADGRLSHGLIMQLAERGDGVPLFLEEAARLALELGSGGAGTELRALEAVPDSLQDLLTARLDALGPAKPIAQVAAVLGRGFSRGLLAELLDSTGLALDAASLNARLDQLCESGLVRPEGEGRFVFRHALIRDAAYASLWARERQALHTRVVELLQQRWPDLAAQQPELLAQHLTEAGLHAQALEQWERAASHAAARSADIEAVSHLRRALVALLRTPPGEERDRRALRLQLLLAARLLVTEGYGAEAVREAYLEAQRLCRGIGDQTARFKVEMGMEAYRFMRAEFLPALKHGQRAADIAQRSGDLKQRLHAHWGLACTLFHQGELRRAMLEMDTALSLYTPAVHAQFGVQDPGLMCMAYSSWALWELGRPDAALARITQAAKMAGEFQHRFSQAVTLAYAVSVELLRGEDDAALVRATACERVCEEYGFPVWLAITRCMRGYLLCARGAFDEGLREMNEGHAGWLRTGALVSQPLYLSLQVEGLLLAGRLQAATDAAELGLAIVARYGERQLEAELCRLRGEIAMRCGDPATGEAWLKRAYVRALRRHRLGFALRSATTLARHWAGSGQHERARRLLAPLLARWTEGRDTRDVRVATALVETL